MKLLSVIRAVADFGGFLILEYQKSSAPKASHSADDCYEKKIQKNGKKRLLVFNLSSATFAHSLNGVATGEGSHRFLVLQYEVAALTGCRAEQSKILLTGQVAI